LVADIAELSSSDFTIFTTCMSGRPPFRPLPHRASLNTAEPMIESKLASSMIFGK
jgi:hypothetical protein